MKTFLRNAAADSALSALLLLFFSCQPDTPAQAQKAVSALKARGGVDIRDEDGSTALIIAARNGHYNTVKLLLDNGADVNAHDKYGTTPLMAILSVTFTPSTFDETSPDFKGFDPMMQQEVKTVKILIDRHADVSLQDKNGSTALMLAAVCQNAAAVDYLIQHGADVNAKDKAGNTALAQLDDILQRDIDSTQAKDTKSANDIYQRSEEQYSADASQQFQDAYAKVIQVIKAAGGY